MQRCALPILLLMAFSLPSFAAPGAVLQATPDSYDFGSRSALDTSPIAHTFVLQSDTKTPVTVDRLLPSCHCTHAAAEQDTDGYGRFTILPGQTARIDVTIDPSDMVPGDLEKEVYVFANGESTPTATLHIKGLITPPVSFSPAILDFGRISSGMAHTQTVIVTVDSRLLMSGQTPNLTCSDPAVQIVRQEKASPVSGATLCQTYRVTIPARFHQGNLRATLLFAPDAYPNTSVWPIPLHAQIVPSPSGH